VNGRGREVSCFPSLPLIFSLDTLNGMCIMDNILKKNFKKTLRKTEKTLDRTFNI
tara:strand:- start:38 stop:202 length:165 start_codon:yes stop_codon:yes gene_type:complete